ncbi:MAG: hypothetical protein KF758_14900 [Anaerolineales bacterium]|nr:hypothetical protein [Anaerolineales bacterium]
MSATVKTLFELLDENPTEDRTQVFEQLWGILNELRAKVDARFSTEPDSSVADLQPYQSADGKAKGLLSAFVGKEIDWMVHSYIGIPTQSFTNMHLTIYLGPHIRAPHFGLATGTMPDIFYYCDYIPRADLLTDLDYLDKYYQPANESYLKFRNDKEFPQFVSKTLYMRTSISEIGHCYLVPPTQKMIDSLRDLSHEMLDRWLKYVDEAEIVPLEERVALAERDLQVRRAIVERDPANPIGEKLFGKQMADRLVRGLWGGDRKIPRPTADDRPQTISSNQPSVVGGQGGEN